VERLANWDARSKRAAQAFDQWRVGVVCMNCDPISSTGQSPSKRTQRPVIDALNGSGQEVHAVADFLKER